MNLQEMLQAAERLAHEQIAEERAARMMWVKLKQQRREARAAAVEAERDRQASQERIAAAQKRIGIAEHLAEEKRLTRRERNALERAQRDADDREREAARREREIVKKRADAVTEWDRRQNKFAPPRDFPCSGQPRECHDCGATVQDDVYVTRWGVICGECRYIRRHGRMPPRAAMIGHHSYPTSSGNYNGGGSVDLNNRRHTVNVRSETHAHVLSEIISEAQDSTR
jgi:hypothetical protein